MNRFLFFKNGVAIFLLMLIVTVYVASSAPVDRHLTQTSGTKLTANMNGNEFFNWMTAKPGDDILQINKQPASTNMPVINEMRLGNSSTGTQRVLVVLVSFEDRSIVTTDQYWNNLFFGTTGKTLRTYYSEQSNGALTLAPALEIGGTANDGIVRVTIDDEHPNTGNVRNNDYHFIAWNALTEADYLVNFGQYDTDHDGNLQNDELHIVIVAAGFDVTATSRQPSVYPTSGGIFDRQKELDELIVCEPLYGGSKVQLGELYGLMPDGTPIPTTLGVIAHEFGHMIGPILPDLYHPWVVNGGLSAPAIGPHSLMDGGAWNALPGELPGTTPAPLDPWSKIRLGWVTPQVIATPETFSTHTVKSVSTGQYNVFKVLTDDPNQYFLVENRQFSGFDAGLRNVVPAELWMGGDAVAMRPLSSGIAVWQVDDSQRNNNNPQRRWVRLIRAGNSWMHPFFHATNREPQAENGFRIFYPPTFNQSRFFFDYLSNPQIRMYPTRGSINHVPTVFRFESVSAPEMSFTLINTYLDSEAPSVPSNLQPYDTLTRRVNLVWDESTDNRAVRDYLVYRAGLSDPIAVVNSTSNRTVSVRIDGLIPGRQYTFTVKARDYSGNLSLASESINVTTQTAPIIGPAYDEFRTSMLGLTSFILNWNASADAEIITNYRVYQGDKLLATVGKDVRSYQVKNLQPGTKYGMKVVSVDANGNLGESEVFEVTTRADTRAPTAPDGLALSALKSTGMELKWNVAKDDIGVTGYHVYLNNNKLNESPLTNTSYVLTNLKSDQLYSLSVRAVDAAGNESSGNQTVSAKTLVVDNSSTTPLSKVKLSSLLVTSKLPTLSYQLSKAANVTVKVYNVAMEPVLTLMDNNTTTKGSKKLAITTKSALPNGTYYVELLVQDGTDKHQTIQTFTIDRQSAPTITMGANAPSSLYSAKDETTIEFSISERAKVAVGVYDSKGKLVHTFANGEESAAGALIYSWNGLNSKGARIKNGNYTLRIQASDMAGNKSTVTSVPLAININGNGLYYETLETKSSMSFF